MGRRAIKGSTRQQTRSKIMRLSRWLAAGLAALVTAGWAAMPQSAQAREVVGFSGNYSTGTIVVKTNERALYYVSATARLCAIPLASAAPASNGPAPP